MMTVPTFLKASSIEGIGVFAVELIPSGSLVWKLDDRFYSIIAREELPNLPTIMQEHFKRFGWPHMKKVGFVCCDIDNGRFMNHSDDPNTDFRDAELAWAIKDIFPGEEITCNYRDFDPLFSGF
jgi:SET domain-containing protein